MSTKFKVGDRVRATDKIDKEQAKGLVGTIKLIDDDSSILVEFDEDIRGHDGGTEFCKMGHCWFVNSNMIELITKEPTPTVNVTVTVNLYENACWYCRKGGLVDLYLAGHPGICPSCGRWCNVAQQPTHTATNGNTSIESRCNKLRDKLFGEFKGEVPKRENRPLTTAELRALPDGTRVFTVKLGGYDKELLKSTYNGWRTKRGDKLERKNGFSLICSNGKRYHSYLEMPEGAVDSEA